MSPSAYRDYYRHISSFETGWLVDVAVEAPGSSPRLIGTGPSRDLQHRRVVAPRYWHVPQRVAIDTYTHQSPWISGGLLAEGTYAKVYLALHKPTAQQLAIKVVYIARPLDAHICEALINELKILEKLARLADSAPFLLTPASVDDKWSWTSPAGFLHITTPFCPGGDLFYYQGCLDSEQLIIVLAEVALGIDFLHKHGIVHHDIKPENVFVDAEGHCVLADYGAAKLLNAKAKIERHPSGKFVSTLAYTAPEILKDREYDDAADWWAFGCTILTLLQGRVYFDFADRKQYLRSYMKLLKTLKPTMRAIDGCLDRLIDLVEGLLHPVPAKRLRGKAVFDHDYFKDLWMAVPGPSSTGGSGLEPTMQTWEAIRLRLHKPPFSVIHAVPTDRGTEKSVCKEWPSKYGSDQRYLIAELVKDGLQLPVDDACDAVALYHQSTIG
ncbi:serine/threonine-protein kinase [Phanerochaete sordida]|uniref:Serine/threonine-protein kinase n=1 Tax=Phanerochaete sordida TaxID=48140 RepID=A0A9P3GC42_9APHY|nr:serine/threonine-protein kinase [Phanerochaete sordida]